MKTTQQRVRETLLAIAYGDAMGMPTENLTKEQIEHRYGEVTDFQPSPDDLGTFIRHLDAGTVTDDTENAVFLCDMLIETGGKVEPEVFVRYLIDWLDHDEKSAVVAGPSTKRAVEAIKHGTPLTESGIWGTTNGAAMKIAPIGLVSNCDDLGLLVSNVAAICLPTHNTQIAIQGASVIAAAVSFMFDNDDVDWDEYYDVIARTARLASDFGNKLPTPDILKRIACGRRIAEIPDEGQFRDELYSFLGTGLDTIQTVPAAVSLVYRYRGNLRSCVRTCASIGGDTDTLGAICGGICGGYMFNLSDDDVAVLCSVNDIDFTAIAEAMAPLVDGVRRC
ncbi:ADP-ribosylglycohydrolase family protein [Bifidobacterium crudilactis]|jgi:ADP-ribosylglycohydrolase|uniref:ADP-ribosylglycohydrolase n=1 Tax=Bifidobacterium crudilactis TaxID=327277 RepID=A0A971CYD2_9BIFI|nr:ADP-ribosylglycohydrolase family protein [Bifidobacterium crudilactis]MCI1888958.1 ADP-ribosylglycohydrolase family protein [Bifidobacterium crudilactis]MDN5972359.1 ADP-ribosylglycohydrolase family protein [Bifidobacterium crudilactis]MDN6000490.1 ADP-ribosylglycohydrolase family protein [Bifidobacterium crudilactis]MDN6208778.1 ADP-ribosylglycohydrolase family protein [Bifidobacterium crudilactis]MDN6233623.1 ADP-ribosylglycohydrolase family protein [Bifidobacterium crudilactis]